MTDITDKDFTIERKSEIIIITYDTDKVVTFNVRDIISYEKWDTINVRIKSAISSEEIKVSYNRCTNYSPSTQDEFLEILRYLIDSNYNYTQRITKGIIDRTGIFNIDGINKDVDTTEETIWNVGGNWSRLSSAQTMSIVSSSLSDTSVAGIGARMIRVIGLDENYDEISENINLLGIVPVITTNSFLIIHYLTIITCGSNSTNVGNITATATSSLTTQARIDAGDGLSKNGFFIVPNKRRAKIISRLYNARRAYGGLSQTYPIIDVVQVNTLSTGAKIRSLQHSIDTYNSSSLKVKNDVSPFFGTGTCFEFRASAEGANNNVVSIYAAILLDYDLS